MQNPWRVRGTCGRNNAVNEENAVGVGVGLELAFVMMGITKILTTIVGEDNRKTWMLITSNQIINNSMAILVAVRCSPMIVFSALGIACKLRVSNADTLLEIIHILYRRPHGVNCALPD
ncbi:hypothetical protein VUR80DRAFT_1183 [Thermomyces stellatus]